jgi:exosortase A
VNVRENVSPARLRAWRLSLVGLVFSIGWVLAWYWTTAAAIVDLWWRSETFAHGFVVPAITAWLIWRERERVLRQDAVPRFWALLLLMGASLVWLVGAIANANSVSEFALVAMLVLLVPAFAGWRVTRAMLFPLLFLFFAVPVGEFMLPSLMAYTADFTVFALRLSGVPVYLEGQHLVIPSGQWSVVEACSGIRYLIASVMVGTLYAYLNYRSLARRLVFVAIAALVPLVANWIRAYLIVMLGHLSSNRLATGVDHIVYGWIFFGIVMALMFWVGSFWHEQPAVHAASPDLPGAPIESALPRPWKTVLMALLVAAVTVAPRLALDVMQKHQAAEGPVHIAPLAIASGWMGSAGGLTNWQPRFLGASDEFHGTFRRAGQTVGLYVAYYRHQNSERKLVSSNNVLVSTQDSAWAKTKSGQATAQYLSQPLRVASSELFNMGEDQRLVAWKWYWIGGYLTDNDFLGKAYTSLIKLSGRGDDSAAIVIYARKGAPGQAEAALSGFLEVAAPDIEQALRQTRDQP